MKDSGVVMISSFFFIPKAQRAIISPSVPEFKPKQYLAFVKLQILFSKFSTSFVRTSEPFFKTLSKIFKRSCFSSAYLFFRSIKSIYNYNYL